MAKSENEPQTATVACKILVVLVDYLIPFSNPTFDPDDSISVMSVVSAERRHIPLKRTAGLIEFKFTSS